MIDPKDIIKKYSVEELCHRADCYFRSISDPTPHMAKPFNSFIESPAMLQNIGILLSGLRIAKTMTILEFAAGTCWFSRLLNQAQCITISCDASKSALEIGKRLFKEFPIVGKYISEPQFLHFNGRNIDLPNESVDRIICHDGFHHIPNQEEVLSELARVLKPGGIAGFCEPGAFHSQTAQSQYEMKNYDVLENDISISEIFAISNQYGFSDIKIKLLSDMEVSLDQYLSLISTKRHSKLGTVLRLVSDPLLSAGIIHNIGKVMISKTIFFLHKGEFVPDSRSHEGLSHSIAIDKKRFSAKAGEDLTISLLVSNTGISKWLNNNINDLGVVKIGTHLYDDSDNLLDLDFSRHCLANVIAPGEVFEQIIKVRFTRIGNYNLSIDLVSEGICWFENIGSKPQVLTIKVE